MAKIKLAKSGFTLVPEGTHVFKITNVDFNETFGKLTVTMETAEGDRHDERFQLIKSDGKANDGALKAFSFFAKTALNDFNRDEIDHTELVGHYIRAEVTHSDPVPSTNNPEKMVQWVRLGDKSPADGFENEPAPAPAPVKQTAGGFDLGKLLG